MSPRTRQSVISFPATKKTRRSGKLKHNDSKLVSNNQVHDENGSEIKERIRITPKKCIDFNLSTPSTTLAALSINTPRNNEITTSRKLPCREDELQYLHNFFIRCIEDKKAGSVYISGLPGTGKTASLSHLISMQEISDNCQLVMANCTSVKSANSIYNQIASSLNLRLRTKTQKSVITGIEKCFMRNSEAQKMILLVLDEIDQLTSKFQTVLYKIFEWPSQENSRLILVGIANAVDLTDRILPRLRSLDLQPQLLHFKPYTKEQIVTILQHRLTESDNASAFAPGSLELISAKVAGQSGDLRRALDLGRRVLELSRSNAEKREVEPIVKTPHKENATDVPPLRRTPRKLGVLENSPVASPRKRNCDKSIDISATPRKTPRKTNLFDETAFAEKENPVRASPRNLSEQRTPCKQMTSTNTSTPSPLSRKSLCRELIATQGVRHSPRKSLFSKDDSDASPSKKPTISEAQYSPRRSPRKLSVGCTPTKTATVNARDVLLVMNQMCASSRRLQTDQSAFPLHQKLLVCTLMLVITKGKNRDINIGKLYEVYRRVCSRRGITAVDLSEFISVCRQVEMAGALEIGKGPGKLAKVTLQWDETEVTHALKDKALLTAILSDTQVLSNKKQ